MKRSTKTPWRGFPVIAIVVALINCQSIDPGGISRVYLTWQQEDTARTMTVHYHTPEGGKTQIYYDTVSRDGKPGSYRFYQRGSYREIKETPFKVHTVQLTGLEPETDYYFVVGDATSEDGVSREFKFTTLPADDTPLRFVQGGDMGTSAYVGALNAQAAKKDPMFALIGGDIAYANGMLFMHPNWAKWLDYWVDHMVRPNGSLIPMVLAIGNHEVNVLGKKGSISSAPFWDGLFQQAGGKTYFRRQFGSNMVVYVLDSGHVASHASQKAWLRARMTADQGIAARYALYHVPFYPSHRDYNDERSVAGRTHWLPLFDELGLTAAFENHDHALKRTQPLRGGQVVDKNEGIIYFGDGCWGRSTREVDPSRWYLDLAQSRRHLWYVELDGREARYQAISETGEVLDTYEQDLTLRH